MSPKVPGLKAVCIDCARPPELARWWADVLGWQVRPYTEEDLKLLAEQGHSGPEEDPAVPIDAPGDSGLTVWFNKVPEPKTVKNRVHVDIYGDVEDILAKGATLIRKRDAEIKWDILADPEGNEFCIFAPD
jgi:hypothetical protein